MANQAYENALATGKVVVRKWWVNTNSQKNQMAVQFQQLVERPQNDPSSINSLLIGLEQGSESLGNTTRVTAIRSFNLDQASNYLGSREGDATMGSDVMFANDLYQSLGLPANIDLAIQVTENFTKNPKATSQTPKINPSTGEVVVATNPQTNTQMPVYRHTEIVTKETCNHTFIASEAAVTPASVNAIGEEIFS